MSLATELELDCILKSYNENDFERITFIFFLDVSVGRKVRASL